MRVLLVYPRFPMTYWGFQHSMPLAGKKAALPPLGLVSLAALLPSDWELRLVDLNIQDLSDDDIRWSDAVFMGGMRIQGPSMHEVIARARTLGRRTVVGGPAPTTSPHEYEDADILFQGEAEGRIDDLIGALHRWAGHTIQLEAHAEDARPSVADVPTPRYDLIDERNYASVSIQYSRGCPFTCEFCDIIEMFGRVPRLKTPEQIVAELEVIYAEGWRGSVFFVDDNFIGNKKEVRKLLPVLEAWQKEHGFPFSFYTEASVNLARDTKLIEGMVAAGFFSVFLGIETPESETLTNANKKQNANVDLEQAVTDLTAAGLEVLAGFIVGFDEDGPSAFEAQRHFIQNSAIPLAMVGMLSALPGTQLWRRLEQEGRLRETSDGDQFDRPNFEPAMDEEVLLRGYAGLMRDLYTPQAFYQRVQKYVDNAPRTPGSRKPTWGDVLTLGRVMYRVGIRGSARNEFWRVGFRALFRTPHTFSWFVAHAVQGEHMIRYTEETLLPRLDEARRDVQHTRPGLVKTRPTEPIPERLLPAASLIRRRPLLDGPWLPATTRHHEP